MIQLLRKLSESGSPLRTAIASACFTIGSAKGRKSVSGLSSTAKAGRGTVAISAWARPLTTSRIDCASSSNWRSVAFGKKRCAVEAAEEPRRATSVTSALLKSSILENPAASFLLAAT